MANKRLADDQILAGATDVSIDVYLVDAPGGSAVTGKVYTDVTVYYHRQGSAAVQITTATLAAVTSSHADGGFKEVDATNLPGIYRLDLTDAAVATNADFVTLYITGSGIYFEPKTFALHVFTTNTSGQPTVASVATGGITSGSFAASAIDATAIASNAITAAKIASDAITSAKVQDGFLTAAKLGADCITAAKVADGALVAANFDTDALSSTAASAAFCQKIADQILARTLGTEAYAALGAVPTVREALFQLLSMWFHSTSGTTLTFKKLDMSTPSATATLSPNATNPTSIVRAS